MTDRIHFGTDDGEFGVTFAWGKNLLGEHGTEIKVNWWGDSDSIFLIDSELEKLQSFLQEGDDA